MRVPTRGMATLRAAKKERCLGFQADTSGQKELARDQDQAPVFV